MIRNLIVIIGWLFLKISNYKKKAIKLYYHLLYINQLESSSYSFGDHFKISITTGGIVCLSSNISFRDNCNIITQDAGKITIGKNTFFNNNCSIVSFDNIEIGSNCLFGENVKLYDHNHRFSDKSKLIKDQGYTTGRIVIGDNVWIGSNVTILKGVSIGDNCVIGTGCVITNPIAPNTITKLNTSTRQINYEYTSI